MPAAASCIKDQLASPPTLQQLSLISQSGGGIDADMFVGEQIRSIDLG